MVASSYHGRCNFAIRALCRKPRWLKVASSGLEWLKVAYSVPHPALGPPNPPHAEVQLNMHAKRGNARESEPLVFECLKVSCTF